MLSVKFDDIKCTGYDAVDNSGCQPVHLAVSRGYDAMVRLLVRTGAAVEERDEHGSTPFLMASRMGTLCDTLNLPRCSWRLALVSLQPTSKATLRCWLRAGRGTLNLPRCLWMLAPKFLQPTTKVTHHCWLRRWRGMLAGRNTCAQGR